MKSTTEILQILEQFDDNIADDFEDQELDFKEWNNRSNHDAIKLVVKMAVCMANGGGGMVVFGVRDKVKGKSKAILGVPHQIDSVMLQKSVYERTDPHITPNFEWVSMPEQDARLLIMRIYPGMPPYTETDGGATMRKGKECVPMTGSLRREVIECTGSADFTASVIDKPWKDLFSAVAMERIRTMMVEERSPEALAEMSDNDLLSSIGAIKNGKMTIGGLLLVGSTDALSTHVSNHLWSFRKMQSSTDYIIKEDGVQAIPTALYEMERYMATENPTTTVQVGFLHPEFNMYPKVALREALLNAFVHRDYRVPGSVMLKHYQRQLVLSNPGSFIGGITEENILHHPPVARNGSLAELLDKLRLVNRSNLGVPRIYKSLLIEGKEPPQYRQIGEAVELTLMASSIIPSFRRFIVQLNEKGIFMDVDHLIVLNYLMRHREIDTQITTRICQRNIDQARELLSYMSNELMLLEAGGAKKGKYFTLKASAYLELEMGVEYDRDKRLDKETIKMRLLSILKERTLNNMEIRQITGLEKHQVVRVMQELKEDGVKVTGSGRGARYYTENETK